MDVKRIQHSKWLGRFLPIDIVVTMGCSGNGSDLPCKHWGDWGFDPPIGCNEVVFEETIQVIKKKMLRLLCRIPVPVRKQALEEEDA